MAPKQQLDFQPQLPVQMAKPETHLDVELTATSQENPPAEAMQSVSELVTRLAPAMWQSPPVKLSENSSPVEAIQLPLRVLATAGGGEAAPLLGTGLAPDGAAPGAGAPPCGAGEAAGVAAPAG